MKYKQLPRQERRVADKKYRYMKATGRSSLVDAAPVQRKIQSLLDRGMSAAQIAEQAGMHAHRVHAIAHGRGHHGKPLRRVRATTALVIAAVKYQPPAQYGRRTNPTGTRRRLQAMSADGFPATLIATLAGLNQSQVWDMAIGRAGRTYIYAATARRIAAVYADVGTASPESLGCLPASASRARTAARKRGWAPRHCWDDDTIDDPAALAQWTGECGTTKGYRLHRMYGIAICQPCRDAASGERKARK